MEKGPAIVKMPELLEEVFVPARISHRDAQIADLENCLRPALSQERPLHAWLYGKPGTGKTLVAKFVLGKLNKEARLGGIYINCWEHDSYYSVLDKLVRELRILGAEKLNTSYKLERLRHFIGQKPFVIVLDEIDQPKREERDSIIYNLGALGKIGLVFICNSRNALYALNDRIKSRLNARQIDFADYTPEQLADILRQRAEMALAADSWDDGTLVEVARLAAGDARMAVQTLRNAARNAENEESRLIRDKHITEGHSFAKASEISVLLGSLSSHHRLLYDVVKAQGEINSGKLWEAYLARCRSEDKPAIALRTFSEYMNKLIELGLVRWDRALVRGKVRVFRVE